MLGCLIVLCSCVYYRVTHNLNVPKLNHKVQPLTYCASVTTFNSFYQVTCQLQTARFQREDDLVNPPALNDCLFQLFCAKDS